MAKTQYIKVRGRATWARVQKDNFDDYRGSKNWKICLFPTKEEEKKIKEAGSQVRVKYDDGEKSGVEGKYYQFKRQVEKDWGRGVEPLTPVEVTYRGEEYTDNIGNGSEVELTLEIYPTKNFGNGTRLVAVDVIDLIEYVKPEESSEEDEEDQEPPFDIEKVVISEPKKPATKPVSKGKGSKIEW